MKLVKHPIAFIVAVVFSVSIAPSACFALGAEGQNKSCAIDNAASLVSAMSAIEGYEDLFGIHIDEFGNLALMDGLDVFCCDDDNGETGIIVWPVLSNGDIVATVLQLPCDDGSVVYKLSDQLIEESARIVENPGLFFLAITDEGTISCLGVDEGAQMVGALSATGPDNDTVPWTDLSHRVAESEVLGASESDLQPFSRTIYRPQIGVPAIGQSNSKLCWAACVASVAQYLTGFSKTDKEISEDVFNGDGNHAGSRGSIQTGLSLHQYTGYSTSIRSTVKPEPLSDWEWKTWINNGLPFIMGGAHSGGSHALVGCGYATTASGTQLLLAMDPDGGKFVELSKTAAGTYSTGSYLWSMYSVVLTGWQMPLGGNDWAWMRSDGTRKTGWHQDYGNWYWFDASGILAEDCWRTIDGKRYRFNPGGSMRTGWYDDGSYWFYLGEDGAASTGWDLVDGYWYAFDSNGAMYRGWYQEGSTWYYLRTAANVPSGGPEGSMLCGGTWTINGKAYRFDSSGACLNP